MKSWGKFSSLGFIYLIFLASWAAYGLISFVQMGKIIKIKKLSLIQPLIILANFIWISLFFHQSPISVLGSHSGYYIAFGTNNVFKLLFDSIIVVLTSKICEYKKTQEYMPYLTCKASQVPYPHPALFFLYH